jgi:phage head maturation protease
LPDTQPPTAVPDEPSEDDAEAPEAVEVARSVTLDLPDEALQTLAIGQRRIGLRIVPYNVVAEHPTYGSLMFEAGAFGEVDPASVRLRMDHDDPPTGLGVSFAERPDGAYMDFQLSKTGRADEQLTLAVDGVSRGASIGFNEIKGRTKLRRIGGKNVTVYGPASAQLGEVSTTWQPTFSEAGVMYVLSKDEKGSGPMAETQEVPVAGIDYEQMAGAVAKALATTTSESKIEAVLEKFDSMIELQRASFAVPQGVEVRKPKLHHWVGVTLRRMAGESISPTELKELALDDVVTGEQPGLVPNRLVPDYDDLISQARPFLSSTRQIDPPTTGTSLILPIITTRAVAGTQAGNAEKGALTTTATKVGTGTFAYKSIFGGADISLQMINRADRSFFDLLTGDLGEAYALDAENKALAALIAGYTDSASVVHAVNNGGVLDPEDPHFGVAWQNSISASKRAPTHIWMNAAAVAAFIDAKAPITNAPLYSNLAASFTAGEGAGGKLSGLTPVYVPAMDDEAYDVIIGPSRGFVWAEDPAIRLQADRPDVAGRDIALVGGIFPAPRFADAFTTYTIAS